MKPNKSKKAKSLKRLHHFPLFIVVGVIAFLVLGAVTVISRQRGKASVTEALVKTAASKQQPNFITVKVAGRDVQVDPQTGQIKTLTPQEAQQLADGLKGMFNNSTEGLVAVRESDGSQSMDLQGRFQNVTVARVNEDGTIARSCVDNPVAAAHFFGIDPQLLGVEAPTNQQAKPAQNNRIQ